MKQEKIGKFISQLRREHNISQEELAKKLCISRQAISKWEVGKTLPDAFNLKKLSEIFSVDVNELLIGEHITKNESEAITNYYFHIYNMKTKKRKIIYFILLIILLSLLILSFAYFKSNFGKTKIYQVSAVSNNFYINDGLFIITNEKSYFKINIKMSDTIKSKVKKMKMYYKSKDDYIYTIFMCDNCNNYDITLYDFNGYKGNFDIRDLDNIIKNTKLEITLTDSVEIIDLIYKEDYKNNKLFYTKVEPMVNKIPVNNSKKNSFDLIDKLIPKLSKSDDGYSIIKNMKLYDIDVTILENVIYLQILKDNKLVEYFSYYEENNVLLYEKFNGEDKVLSLLFNLKTRTCNSSVGKCCDETDIFNLFTNYLNKI